MIFLHQNIVQEHPAQATFSSADFVKIKMLKEMTQTQTILLLILCTQDVLWEQHDL